MEPRPREPPSPPRRKSKHASKPSSEGFSRFAGQTPSTTRNCGNERDSSLLKTTSFKEAGDGSLTTSVSLNPVNTTRQAFTWNPQGKMKRGRSRNTWRCDVVANTKRTGLGSSWLEGADCSRWGCRR